MPKLPVLSGKDVIKLLTKLGFEHVRTTGSHAILRKEDKEKGKIVVPVPLHKELAKGTLLSIINQVGLTREEFLDLLK